MTTSNNDGDGKKLKLKRPGKLELSKTVEQGQVRQSFSHGRTKQVAVEVKRKRTYQRNEGGRMTEVKGGAAEAEPAQGEEQQTQSFAQQPETETQTLERGTTRSGRQLTEGERQARLRALETARRDEEERKRRQAEEEERRRVEAEEEAKRKAEEEARRKAEEEAQRQLEAEEEARRKEKEAKEAEKQGEVGKAKEAESPAEQPAETPPAAEKAAPAAETTEAKKTPGKGRGVDQEVEEELGGRVKRSKPGGVKAPTPAKRTPTAGERRRGKLTISQALEGEEGDRARSLAAVRRQREREKQRRKGQQTPQKVVREVVIPDAITVGELAQRMAVRGAEVVKSLMKIGTMATINQTIDAETAELIVEEFGHKAKRVSESDVEEGLKGGPDREEELQPRAPVVTVMGHVDHGKTSLLDALRKTDVVGGEAGGITQHIGAYQVKLPSDNRITFIDTPGHAAFTEMRSRGATVTDIVILVVAADDSVMNQTVEAINHAKAAGVPIIVAINKCDKPDANPDRVRQELLNYGVIVEEMGGEDLAVEVSAINREGLDKLEEAILLQAEILELKANPDRPGEGSVIEAKLEKGRGPVATVLVQRGTLRQGDIFVAGSEWGRVRALINDRGEQVKEAGPSEPVEVLGLQGTPKAGDEFVVVENEQRAREISEFRQEQRRQKEIAASGRGSLEQMLSRIKEGEVKEMPLVVKADVQGSLEAIIGALEKMGNEEVRARVLHAGVGGISESDVTLAGASDAIIVAFNVRANAKAREVAKRDGVDIRYYSVIYNVVDDVKAALEGMLSPVAQENFIGYAEIRQVFSISKVGKVAGCRVTEGVVKRGAGVRLLRDNVVVYEGHLKTLKRFKDEVKEVKEGYECGIALENFNDIREGDVLECYETQEVSRVLS
ncbi:translation initiation factor IF-2 [Ferruginivarius sediminum]|uniref:Translation initiation factor IF-2 n=1 Tax=Ferruginivarius sediminum TaxID=2661937 RepID=A0A369TGS2_9PROT|nr:translation initiation factor IF-2 [Ferruginivarius sediminum]RDD63337.1 translation initiation factor IF-2 [Ferruginivarius sediminum]